MTHLLDTNVCIAAMRGNRLVLENLQKRSPSDCGISTVSYYELLAGVERCQKPDHERQKVENFIAPLHLVPFDDSAAERTAVIRWHLEKRGQTIGPYDLMLAGQTLSLEITLVTHNLREFQRIPNLLVEDWQTE